ncbi:MAG: GGDEF domain-containing protein, partial [Firmicutes bacterium]|nr:GGDEF domain-containing protein [Bacillota bacterium]
TVFHDLMFHSILMSDYQFLSQIIRTGNLSSFGLLVFTLSHSFVLAGKYANTFNKNEEMTLELMDLNENLESIVEKRTEDLLVSHQKIEEQKQALEKTNRKLEMMSQKDGLTNVWNRRHFDEVMTFEWHRAYRFKHRLSLLFLDVDDFKDFNDEHGHQAGDRCLQQVALILHELVKRSVDVVARYGGEEFVVLLSETDHQGATAIAEALRSGVESLGITVSIGVATMVPNFDLSPNDLILAADKAMYKAKEKGKNRIENHGSGT